MKSFEFSIIATGLDPTAETFETRFYEAGCDNATISFQKGHIIVDFARCAPSMDEAIATALEAVRSTGATVMRVEPDPLVSLADIAARTGLTRAAITNYAKARRGVSFPAPVARVTSESPLWDWHSVVQWLVERQTLPLEALHEALAVKNANDELSRTRLVT